jgi:hypothetical protein
MKKHGISDDDAEALVTGAAPADRPDLATLAHSIAEFRSAAFATPPRPSAALRTRLDLAPEISARPETSRSEAFMGRMKRMFAWFAGLGIAAKIVLGVSVAAAAGATGVGTAVGINTLVSATSEQEQVAPEDGATDAPTDDQTETPENFGSGVSDRAHELGKDSDGAAFGEEVSEEAQQLGDDKAQDRAESDPEGSGSGDAENGQGSAPELPDHVPGGDD